MAESTKLGSPFRTPVKEKGLDTTNPGLSVQESPAWNDITRTRLSPEPSTQPSLCISSSRRLKPKEGFSTPKRQDDVPHARRKPAVPSTSFADPGDTKIFPQIVHSEETSPCIRKAPRQHEPQEPGLASNVKRKLQFTAESGISKSPAVKKPMRLKSPQTKTTNWWDM
ncbi:hypothetical protein ETB97_003401 [Aspergillus alliaceus]|uniref:Uncharacterized protein n=1 Tax=Petromyces alliaceus TaxID=209559 RepID=A0A8H6AE64_PETAA|nr:hypothetical protein ETB97_003401 [Aspergillus burnettii]